MTTASARTTAADPTARAGTASSAATTTRTGTACRAGTAAGTRAATSTGPATCTRATTGTRPATRTRATTGTRPATRTRAATGTRPATRTRAATGTRPATRTRAGTTSGAGTSGVDARTRAASTTGTGTGAATPAAGTSSTAAATGAPAGRRLSQGNRRQDQRDGDRSGEQPEPPPSWHRTVDIILSDHADPPTQTDGSVPNADRSLAFLGRGSLTADCAQFLPHRGYFFAMYAASGSILRVARLALWLGLPALLAACGSHSEQVVSLPPTPPPQYGIGDSYSFSDGSSATVVVADRNRVRWKGTAGEWVTTNDVMVPSLSWHSGNTLGERAFAGDAMLFPLEPGKTVLFSATSSMRSSFGGPSVVTREQWRCNVLDAVSMETPAGRFPTWRVDCTVAEQPQTGGSAETRRSYYYAPEIGYFVRRVEHLASGDTRVVNLVRYTSAEPSLPAAALALRVASIQGALEHDQSGAAADWRDPATGDRGTVEPLRTVRSQQYGWCRDFAEHINVAGRVYTLDGTGCRNRAGNWDIVSLAPTINGNG